jgi:hypothetical protein
MGSAYREDPALATSADDRDPDGHILRHPHLRLRLS